MMKISPQMKKILMIIGLLLTIGIVVYLIVSLTSKSKKTTSSRRYRLSGMIKENYENIVLQVTSFCGNGNVFNNKTNKCSVDSDYSWNTTSNNQIMLADNTNTALINLNFNSVTDQFFASQADLTSGTQYNVETAKIAVPFVPVTTGIKRTIIPLTYSTSLFAPAPNTTQTAVGNVSLFINNSSIQTMLKSKIPVGNSTGIPSTAIFSDPNTTITLDSNGQNLIITSQWATPYVATSACVLPTGSSTWIARRRFDLSQSFVTPPTTPTIYQQNILRVGGTYLFSPLNNSVTIDVACPDKKDCQVAPKSSSGTVSRKTDGSYDFTLTLTFDITAIPNADGLICTSPTLYPNLNITASDNITQDLTNKLVTIIKKVNLSYNSIPSIDINISSPGLQLLVKQATNYTGNADAKVINDYASVFTDFFGDISRLPLLVLSAVGANKVYNNIQNGLITTNIVGQKLYGTDLNLDNLDTQNLVKNMVKNMTGILPDNIQSLGIFNTFKIKSGTIQLYAQQNGALTASATPPTTISENDKLWIFVKTATDTGYIQHLSSFKYLPGGTGNLTTLVDNKDVSNLVKSSYNFANTGTGTIQLNSNNTFLTITTTAVSWSTTSSTLNFETSSVTDTSLGLLNSILSIKSWTQLSTTASTSNMLAANTTADLIPSSISLDGQGKAIFNGTVDRTNSSTDIGANTNLAIYNNLNNLPNTSLSKPFFAPIINNLPNQNLRYVFWDNSALSGLISRAGTISGITFGNANVYNNNWQTNAWIADNTTSPVDGQFQWVNLPSSLTSTLTAKFYLDANKYLRGSYSTTTDKVISSLMSTVKRFSTWANQSSNSTEIRILYSRNVNSFNNLTLLVINSPTDFTNNTYLSSTESTLFPDNTSGFIADWVALNGSRAMVTDTNNNLYYTPDLINTNNPIWMKVNTPEPVKVVDFKNNYAAIITTTNKVYVANNF